MKGRPPLNSAIREFLPWRTAALRSATERRTWFRWSRHDVVYVDATVCGYLGVLVYADDEQSLFPPIAPGGCRAPIFMRYRCVLTFSDWPWPPSATLAAPSIRVPTIARPPRRLFAARATPPLQHDVRRILESCRDYWYALVY